MKVKNREELWKEPIPIPGWEILEVLGAEGKELWLDVLQEFAIITEDEDGFEYHERPPYHPVWHDVQELWLAAVASHRKERK